MNTTDTTDSTAGTSRRYGIRPPRAGARLHHAVLLEVADFAVDAYDALHASFEEDFSGLTTDGVVRPGLFTSSGGHPTAPAVEAARAYLRDLRRADHRIDARADFDHPHRRWWFNAFPDWAPRGVLLDDLTQPERDAALEVIRLCLGETGFAETRKAMRLNGLLGEFVRMNGDSLSEWSYFFAIYGEPSEDQPWAWQLMGHHVDLNCLVLPDHVELTPMFLGSEFNQVEGVTVFDAQADDGLAFVRSLDAAQQEEAVLYWSMGPDVLPPELAGDVAGRHVGGAGADNLVRAYEGVGADGLDDSQRERLVALVDLYLARFPDAQRAQRLREVREHLDETHFAWIGDPAQGAPFYYRIHSPVIWIEFDHHPGIFLDNDLPEPYHVHTIIRTPNGGDYGHHLVPLPAVGTHR